MWKIADFGFVTEGTSNTAQPTRYARGTQCYRAPELIQESPGFNNKVDIWALGCVLYELLFSKKAFDSDFTLFQFSAFPQPFQLPSEIPPSIDEVSFTALSTIIVNCLNAANSDRPSATELYRMFSDMDAPELSESEHPDPQFPLNGNDAQLSLTDGPFIANASVSSPNGLGSSISTPTVEGDRMIRPTTGPIRRRRGRNDNGNPISGLNSRGSNYVRTGPNSFRYNNPDGSFFYQNENGSRYFQRRDGYWQYTPLY